MEDSTLRTNEDGDGSDHDDSMQYVKKEFFQPISGGSNAINVGNGTNSRHWYRRYSDAESTSDESNHFFMSEPSVSEADSSENPMRLLVSPGNSLEDRLLYGENDDNDDDDDDAYLGRPPPPPIPAHFPPYAAGGSGIPAVFGRGVNSGVASPGNASFSSWDMSPSGARHIQLQFSPPTRRDGASAFVRASVPTSVASLKETTGESKGDTDGNRNKTPDATTQEQQHHYYSSNSTSPASDSHIQQLDEFLDELRINSEGQVQDSSVIGPNSSLDMSFNGPADVQGVLRRSNNGSVPPMAPDSNVTRPRMTETQQQPSSQSSLAHHERTSSVDTAIVQNTSGAASSVQAVFDGPRSGPTSVDDDSRLTAESLGALARTDDSTIVMTLSDSGDEAEDSSRHDSVGIETLIDESRINGRPNQRATVENSASGEASSQSAVDLSRKEQEVLDRATAPKSIAVEIQRSTIGNEDYGPMNLGEGARPSRHRPQRSGNAAAATLVTKSEEWKEVKVDQLSLPVGHGNVFGGNDKTDWASSQERKGHIEGRAEQRRHPKQQLRGTVGDHDKGHKISNSPGISSKVGSQANEIAQFSHFALGTNDSDSPSARPRRRTREISYRTRRKQLQNETLETASQGSTELQYLSFFQPPASSSPPPPPPPPPEHSPVFSSYLQPRTQGFSSPTLSGYSHSPVSYQWNSQTSAKGYSGSNFQTFKPPVYYGSYDSSRATPPLPWSPDTRHIHQPPPPFISPHHNRNYSEIPLGGPLAPSSSLRSRAGSDQQSGRARGQGYRNEAIQGAKSTFNMPFSSQLPSRASPVNNSDNIIYTQSSPSYYSERAMSFDRTPRTADQLIMPSPSFLGPGGQGRGFPESSPQPHHESPKHDDPHVDDDSYTCSDESSDDTAEFEDQPIHHHHPKVSPFAFNRKTAGRKFDRRQFLPQTSTIDDGLEDKYPTYICPVCKTRQREFFTVSSAPRQFESAGGHIAVYFTIYVVASLYIFGLQEGWGKLDCIYFAVITLTTAGLGDFVPTTDGAKIICSIFIYFGVACIGLLLGSYIAGMLDERSHREALANQMKACPNCARIRTVKDGTERQRRGFSPSNKSKSNFDHLPGRLTVSSRNIGGTPAGDQVEGRASKKIRRMDIPTFSSSASPVTDLDVIGTPKTTSKSTDQLLISSIESPTVQNALLGSPMTSEILGRQTHTRHMSMDMGHSSNISGLLTTGRFSSGRPRNFSMEIPATVEEGVQPDHDTETQRNTDVECVPPPPPFSAELVSGNLTTSSDEYSMESSESDESNLTDSELEGNLEGVRNAKYVFLTMREALVNSMLIIAFGCMGFFLIEGFSFIDSWYFTTVLLTTVGYGGK